MFAKHYKEIIMGLDMYIFQKDKEDRELAYWRKHRDLHGYIIRNFADGVDECQPIPLSKDNIENIIDAVEKTTCPIQLDFSLEEVIQKNNKIQSNSLKKYCI
jgi:hypothetical protein